MKSNTASGISVSRAPQPDDDRGTIASSRFAAAAGRLARFRTVIYVCTFASGVVALTLQIVWQRYLSFLFGSEAKSISLIVAVFLLGLAAGYQFWGSRTHGGLSRKAVMKMAGYVELGIAAYALAFSSYFGLVRQLANSGPNTLAFDALLAGLLLLPPTFLMGASIPLLTAAVPESSEEVNYCHSRIYGINTLGAFFGALAAGFYLVPGIGLIASLILCAVASAVIGLVFLFNPLEGAGHKATDIPRIPNAFGSGWIYGYVFVTGAVSISLEVLFTRVMSLTIGSGHYVFPIVVGVVILGLAVGSLSLKRTGLAAVHVPRELLKLGVALCIVYLTVPYWPYWISHVRVSLVTIPSNFFMFQILVILFVTLALLPLLIPMGRLLPMGYALINKTGDDYGKMCGRVYCLNTLGTVFGAVGLGYVAFLVLDLPWIFKLNMTLLLGLAAALWLRESRPRAAVVCAVAAVAALFVPGWDRLLHYTGLFRVSTVEPYHFQGLFTMPAYRNSVTLHYLRDDPMMTVAAYTTLRDRTGSGVEVETSTIAVNGKSDGNTLGDYTNMVLAGMIPYLHARPETGVRAAVIGLGTGMTSGALAIADDVASVTTLEISDGVIEALPHFDEGNFFLSRNAKSRIVQTDAFRFFARTGETFDVIASEPSNPWVVGVENLFTPEFYQLITQSLNEGGVFFQWIQMYENNDEIMAAIARNVVSEFEHVSLYIISPTDVGILASHAPLSTAHIDRRLAQPGAVEAMYPMGLEDPALLALLEAYRTDQVKALAAMSLQVRHSVEFPWIGHAAGRAKFLRQTARLKPGPWGEMNRHMDFSPRRREGFSRWMPEHQANLDPWCDAEPERLQAKFICDIVTPLAEYYRKLKQPLTPQTCKEVIEAYGALRNQSFIDQDLNLLAGAHAVLVESAGSMPPADLRAALEKLVSEYGLEWQWDRAHQIADESHASGHLTAADHEQFKLAVDEYYERAAEWSASRQ